MSNYMESDLTYMVSLVRNLKRAQYGSLSLIKRTAESRIERLDSMERLPRARRKRLIRFLYLFLRRQSTRLWLWTQLIWRQQAMFLEHSRYGLGILVMDNRTSQWVRIPPSIYDADISFEGRELSSLIIFCRSCCSEGPFPYFYSYV